MSGVSCDKQPNLVRYFKANSCHG